MMRRNLMPWGDQIRVIRENPASRGTESIGRGSCRKVRSFLMNHINDYVLPKQNKKNRMI